MPKGFQKGNKVWQNRKPKHKKTLEKEQALNYIKKRVFEELEPMISAKLDLATGCWVGKRIGKEWVRVYQEKPDREAIEDLLNRTLGKIKETMEIEGNIDLDINLKKIVDKVYGSD